MATTVAIPKWRKPDRKLSTDFIATKVDGPLLPHVLDEEVYFNEPKDKYDEIDENTP